MYHIQLMGTKKCNKECYYCTTHSNDGIEVDLDFTKYVLDSCPNDLAVELTGGEIGLIQNLDAFYRIVREHPHVKHIKALSNGLLRKVGVDWLKDVEYWEHLIYEIKGKEIIKFYHDLNLASDHIYVIVTTESTTRSLLANWKYFLEMGLFKPNFFYKLMNHKSNTNICQYTNELFRLYTGFLPHTYKDEDRYFLKMLLHSLDKNVMADKKLLCQKWSPNTYVDLQSRELGHCAMNVNLSTKIDFSKENLNKLIDGEFSDNSYCQDCYSFDNGKNRSSLNNRSYIQ